MLTPSQQPLPGNRRRELRPIGTTAFSHGVRKMSAYRAKADAQYPGDVTVSATAGDQGGDLNFSRRQTVLRLAAKKCPAQVRLQRVEQVGIAFAKIGTAASPPDAEITKIALAVEDEHIHAVM